MLSCHVMSGILMRLIKVGSKYGSIKNKDYGIRPNCLDLPFISLAVEYDYGHIFPVSWMQFSKNNFLSHYT